MEYNNFNDERNPERITNKSSSKRTVPLIFNNPFIFIISFILLSTSLLSCDLGCVKELKGSSKCFLVLVGVPISPTVKKNKRKLKFDRMKIKVYKHYHVTTS